MNSLQVACRLIPRALGARAIATTPRAMSVSMKQPLDASASRGAVPSTDSYQKFMALQTHMTNDDGKLVWQKGGGRDAAQLYTTFALIILGLGVCGQLFWTMAWPRPKPEE